MRKSKNLVIPSFCFLAKVTTCMTMMILLSGCGVMFRDLSYETPIYRSVVQDSKTIWRIYQGESWVPGLEASSKDWRYFCIGIPVASVIYAIDMPLCLIVDTVGLPYDLYRADNPDKKVIKESEWYLTNLRLIEQTKQVAIPNGLEIFIGIVRKTSDGKMTIESPELIVPRHTNQTRTILGLEDLPYFSYLQADLTTAFFAYRGLKGESHVISTIQIKNYKVITFQSDRFIIEVSGGINMNSGCSYEEKRYKFNDFVYGYAQHETQGEYFEMHRKYELAQWMAGGISHKIPLEHFTTDMAGNHLTDPPKATWSAPELRFCYCPKFCEIHL